MPQSHSSRDMSTLVGTSKTLERAISGLQMNTQRLCQLLADEITDATPGLTALIASLKKLGKDEQAIVDAILSHRGKIKRKAK